MAMETGNLMRLAPLWLQHTVSLRMDPDAARLAGEGADKQHASCALAGHFC